MQEIKGFFKKLLLFQNVQNFLASGAEIKDPALAEIRHFPLSLNLGDL